MSRLPVPGSDDGTWGTVLNDYLTQSHNADGTLKPSSVATAGAETTASKGQPSGYAPLDSSSKVPSANLPAAATTTPDATTSSRGVVQLAGDLAGTAAAPTVPGLATTEKTANKGAASGYAPLNASSQVPIANLPTGTTSASVAIGNDARLTAASTALQLGGDIGGTSSAPTVAKLQGTTVNGSSPAGGQVLTYSTGASAWVPATVTSTTVSDATTASKGIVQLSGDLGGTASSPTVPTKVTKAGDTMTGKLTVPSLQVTGGSPASGQILTADASGNATWQTAVTGSSTLAADTDVTLTSPATGQVLTYDGTASKWKNQAAPTASDATTSSKGVVQLSGDLAGTAASPTVAKLGGITLPGSVPSANQVLTASSGTATTWSTPAAGVTLDTTAGDIQPLGSQAAGAIGKAADAGHVHAMPRLDQVASPTAAVALSAQKITGLANGTNPQDAAAFGQLPVVGTTAGTYAAGNDARITGALQSTNNLSDVGSAGSARQNLHVPALSPAACVTTTNVAALSGLNTYDGYTLIVGDQVLLTGQTSASQNGPWVAASGSWTRPTDFATGNLVKARTIAIIQGTTYGGSIWLLQTNGSITVDTTAQTWVSQLPSSVVSGARAGSSGGAAPTNTSWVPNPDGSGGWVWAAPTGGAGLPSNIRLVTTAPGSTAANDFVEADVSGGGFTVPLPNTPAVGSLVAVKKVDASGNSLVIAPQAGGSIDGSANASTSTQWAGLIFEFRGQTGGFDVWRIIASMTTTGPAGAPGLGFGNVFPKVANYPIVSGDSGKVLTFNGASLTGTLPPAAPGSPWMVTLINLNATTLTVSPNGLTLNGSGASITLAQNQGIFVWSDGTNYEYATGPQGSQGIQGPSGPTVPGLWFFGDGSDGSATITTTVTLTKDTHYLNLTVNSGGTLLTDGWRVFVRGTLTVNSGGAIHIDGNDAALNIGGTARGSNQRSLAQATGGATANQTGAGTAAGALTAAASSLGGVGGTGGASGANAGGAGSSAGALGTMWAAVPYTNAWRQPKVLFEGLGVSAQTNNGTVTSGPITPGSGGGGGANDGTGTGGAGGGGGGGGVLLINAATVVNNGRISASGGVGGNANARNGGGGGGGGGGVVLLNTGAALTGSNPVANGGAGGTANGTGSVGVAGAAGTVHVYVVA